ncbi:BrnT family toxin [Adlercreutzia sp. ZJ473]|uniref:BrnT family toxin n=1 Tax=Adlercreutzia sp. ZJ473 TaxID=2722822 RepID=UPI001554ACDD|nr:BrnT family toxin [Adlercreutzia sp. ZJ473]
MAFEYDPNKSAANKEKHGIDFEEAQGLWDDEWRMATAVQYRGERRELLIAHYAGSCWTAIYTMRGERIRIISVRRATQKEVAYYDRKRNER